MIGGPAFLLQHSTVSFLHPLELPHKLKATEYPKHHGNTHGHEPTNYTAFLPKDKNVGTVRANRPDILFQIYNHEIRSVRPTGYVKDNGCTVKRSSRTIGADRVKSTQHFPAFNSGPI